MRAARSAFRRLAACGIAALSIGGGIGRGMAAEATLRDGADACPALPAIAIVIADDERLRSEQAFEDERALRDFALFWYRNLAGDLVDGHGPAVDVLADAFRPACPHRDVLLDWLRSLLVASPTGADFSRRLAMVRANFVRPRSA